MNISEVKPLFRWAGSKKKLLPYLYPYWIKSGAKRYVEPFVGSAQLYFKIAPVDAILNDVNTELINTYRVIQKNSKKLHTLLSTYERDKDFYYHLRALDLSSLDRFERAARFLYLNKFCFNGLYRTNKKGDFNVPYSISSTGRLPSLEELKQCSESLKNVLFTNNDFEKVIRDNVREGDFIYLDPPYAVANGEIFNQYDPRTFGINDLERLRNLLIDLDNRNIPFLLSYANCIEFRKRFSDWKTQEVETQRNMTGFSRDKRIAKELLISNI